MFIGIDMFDNLHGTAVVCNGTIDQICLDRFHYMKSVC